MVSVIANKVFLSALFDLEDPSSPTSMLVIVASGCIIIMFGSDREI